MAGTSSACNPEPGPSLWLARQPLTPVTRLPDWLSGYERHVAAEMATGRLNEFIHSRWLVRQALAAVSNSEPAACRPVHGRPLASQEPPGWHLSLSHSHGMSACGVAPAAGIGIDIEPGYRAADWRSIVKRWFTPAEQAWLLARGDDAAFLRTWTLKEAWLKATGRGIANNLKTLEMLADGQLLGDRPDQHWQARLSEVSGFLVAVVWQAPPGGPEPRLVELGTDDNQAMTRARRDHSGATDWALSATITAREAP